ncbi:MAG: dihydroorotase [Spirochaetales bacterium]|nr:dihydroorotase [Spirochaetales bacterium]
MSMGGTVEVQTQPKPLVMQEAEFIEIPMPDDLHVHLRQGQMLVHAVRAQAGQAGRLLVMPNTLPPVSTLERLAAYRAEVDRALADLPPEVRTEPLYTFKILPEMRADEVLALALAGVVAGKYYPSGATTNAADGPRSFEDVADILEAMQEVGLVLSIHGEDPDAPVFERERAFLPQVEQLLARYPRLRIVLEHLSDAESVDFVRQGPERLGATITAHHLLFTLEDMMGSSFNPHLYCKPVLKTAQDREALCQAVLSGSPKFFFGSDSAPHPRSKKECAAAASGVFAAPTAVPALVELFETLGGPASLAHGSAFLRFMAGNGAAFYGLPAPYRTLTLLRTPWVVPAEIGGVVPMLAGHTLAWQPVRGTRYASA